jgi:hypothetical protein
MSERVGGDPACQDVFLARSITSGDPEQGVFNASLTIVVLTLLTAPVTGLPRFRVASSCIR